MSPVTNHPAATFDLGLVTKLASFIASIAVKAAPARNKSPNKRAVTHTNGFIGYWDNFMTRSITSFGWFMTSRI